MSVWRWRKAIQSLDVILEAVGKTRNTYLSFLNELLDVDI